MKKICKLLGIIYLFSAFTLETGSARANVSGCLSCHNGIESIRDEASGMLQLIKALSAGHGDQSGCILCHGGDPTASTAEKAHKGSPKSLVDFKGPQTFYPDPGAMDSNEFRGHNTGLNNYSVLCPRNPS